MTQAANYSVPLVGPSTPTNFAQRIDDTFDAIISGHSGSARPAYAVAGMIWEDTSVANETRLYFYDGAQDILVAVVDTANDRVELAPQPLVDVASAGTTDIGAVKSRNIRVTGTTTITSFGTIRAGTTKTVYFAAALTVTYNATSLITPTGASLAVSAGDSIDLVSLGSGNWRVLRHVKSSQANINYATPVVNPNTAAVLFTGIPAGVKRITAHITAMSFSAAGAGTVRLGVAGAVQNTSYGTVATDFANSAAQTIAAVDTTGVRVTQSSSTGPFSGAVVFERASSSGNVWTYKAFNTYGTSGSQTLTSGTVTLTGDPDRLQFTTVAGTPLINGTMNISWEF